MNVAFPLQHLPDRLSDNFERFIRAAGVLAGVLVSRLFGMES
jgi:hypothetical protein